MKKILSDTSYSEWNNYPPRIFTVSYFHFANGINCIFSQSSTSVAFVVFSVILLICFLLDTAWLFVVLIFLFISLLIDKSRLGENHLKAAFIFPGTYHLTHNSFTRLAHWTFTGTHCLYSPALQWYVLLYQSHQ